MIFLAIIMFLLQITLFILVGLALFSVSDSALRGWEGSRNRILENFNLLKKDNYQENRKWIPSFITWIFLALVAAYGFLYVYYSYLSVDTTTVSLA